MILCKHTGGEKNQFITPYFALQISAYLVSSRRLRLNMFCFAFLFPQKPNTGLKPVLIPRRAGLAPPAVSAGHSCLRCRRQVAADGCVQALVVVCVTRTLVHKGCALHGRLGLGATRMSSPRAGAGPGLSLHLFY